MAAELNLIKTEYRDIEKRVLPHFPFSYLNFREPAGDARVFEVHEISMTGMQMSLKDGNHKKVPGQKITGQLHWHSLEQEVRGTVIWERAGRLGIKFDEDDMYTAAIKKFLSIDHFVDHLRPIHRSGIGLDVPNNLKYWLTADGPMELFVWGHNDGELACFQFVMMEKFVEWEDGKGISTGRVLTVRDMDTPLYENDEFMFQMDADVDDTRIEYAQAIVLRLTEEMVPKEIIAFLKRKLGC